MSGFDLDAIAEPPQVAITEDGFGLRREWERLRARHAVGAGASVDDLIAAAGDRDETVATRLAAVEFLGHRGAAARAALPVLRELRAAAGHGTRNPDGEGMDLGAIGAITGTIARIVRAEPDALGDLELAVAGRWRGYVPEADARLAIAKLETFGPDGVKALCYGLRQARATVRLAAIHALERIGPPASDALPDLDLLIVRRSLDQTTRDAARRAAAAIRGDGR